MDITTWITTVTAVANMLKAWMDARKSGLDFDQAKSKALSAQTAGDFSDDSPDLGQMTISDSLLEAYIEDISNAEKRMVASINDPRFTPAEKEKEETVAQKSICVHLGKIKQYNAGSLPSAALERIWNSYGCDNA